MKIKGSQGNRRVEWVKVEHPFTAISPEFEVHANHNEAQNAALRRQCSAYRRRQNLYAKKLSGLQQVLDVQWLIHNWVRPHWGLGKQTTPSMKMGFCSRPLTILELLNSRGFMGYALLADQCRKYPCVAAIAFHCRPLGLYTAYVL